MKWQEYIVSNPEILFGKPIIKGTRISVELILELLSTGWTQEFILTSYPKLTSESIKAVYAYSKDSISREYYFPATIPV